MRKLGIEYPVAQDNQYGTWNAYANCYWQAKYLIDTDGFVVYSHFGEGGYGEAEKRIQEALAERSRVLLLANETPAGGLVDVAEQNPRASS